jgi:hypothetical protein
MTIIEKKLKQGYKYEVPMKEGTFYYISDKQIRGTDKKTETILDDIFQKILNSSNKGQFEHEGYKIKYFKNIPLWLKK